MAGLVIKPGRLALDPHGRRVRIQEVRGETVIVRLAGSYAATVQYPKSCLTAIEEVDPNGDGEHDA